jgi:large subunit ribosomal protein L6
MSRIGNAPITVPDKVEIKFTKGNFFTVKGPKGELKQQLDAELKFEMNDGEIGVSRPTDQPRHRAAHGLNRSLLNNMVVGVTEGFVKELELIGVGYRVNNTGNLLELALGYSHPIYFYVPDEVSLETKMEKGKSPYIRLECTDKQLVGQIAAKIRGFRKPEPYKGKGVRYKGEEIRRKAGKAAAAK